MERLTKRTAANGIILTGIFTSATYDTPEEVRQLLADYEDTGLTPERCAELSRELERANKQLKAADECIARCQEALDDLAEADSD